MAQHRVLGKEIALVLDNVLPASAAALVKLGVDLVIEQDVVREVL